MAALGVSSPAPVSTSAQHLDELHVVVAVPLVLDHPAPFTSKFVLLCRSRPVELSRPRLTHSTAPPAETDSTPPPVHNLAAAPTSLVPEPPKTPPVSPLTATPCDPALQGHKPDSDIHLDANPVQESAVPNQDVLVFLQVPPPWWPVALFFYLLVSRTPG